MQIINYNIFWKIHKLHYTLFKRYELRLSLSGIWHSDGRCCSIIYYKNHWGQLRRGRASLGSNILWRFPRPRTAAYKGHFLHGVFRLLRGKKGWWQHGAGLGRWSRTAASASSGRLAFAVRSWEVSEGTSSPQTLHVEMGASVSVRYKGLCTPWIILTSTDAKKSINFDRILAWSRAWRRILPCLNIPPLGCLLFSAFLGMGCERTFVTW